jgi:uncharacterized protein YjiK
MKYILIIILVVIAGAGFMYRDNLKTELLGAASKEEKKKDKKDKDKDVADAAIEVKQQWNLPGRLKEISGLQYLDGDRFACVQDEEGVVFIYNIKNSSIEKEISFAGAGDYEGLAVAGNSAYVVRSDGQLYEIQNWLNKPVIKQHKTSLTADHNVEGLYFDAKQNRLLLAIKDEEPGNKDYKGVYAFSLANNTFDANPVYKLSVDGEGSGKKKKGMKPSDIAMHPSTNELYVLDGPASKLVVLDESGNMKQRYNLGSAFEQPEGISFNDNGDLFISNEGVKGAGNIVHVVVK